MVLQAQPRRKFLKSVGLVGAAALSAPYVTRIARAAAPEGATEGLRSKIDHIVVLFQENRSFDHYFGVYKNPAGAMVTNLLDPDGRVDTRFTGLQKNPAGIPYNWLPVPEDIPGFDSALLDNRPFHLAPYIPATHNVPWDPVHHFFRMTAQIDQGRMDRFVALAQSKHHAPFASLSAKESDPLRMTFAQSKPSGAVIGFYERADVAGYHELADQYVLFDNFFQAMTRGSTGNALYLAAARSAVWHEVPRGLMGSLTPPVFDMPYGEEGIMINDLPPLSGPTSTDAGQLRALLPLPNRHTLPSATG